MPNVSFFITELFLQSFVRSIISSTHLYIPMKCNCFQNKCNKRNIVFDLYQIFLFSIFLFHFVGFFGRYYLNADTQTNKGNNCLLPLGFISSLQLNSVVVFFHMID